MKNLRVVIDARLTSGDVGGTEQVVIGLAKGLSLLTDGDEEYLFLVYRDSNSWLMPYLSGPCRHVACGGSRILRMRRRVRQRMPGLGRSWDRLLSVMGGQGVEVPQSDGTVERIGAEVVHFPLQSAFLTEVPSIYHPHDLQHLHMPALFPSHVRKLRDVRYRAFCSQAAMVAVSSSWVKKDLIHHYGLSMDKVRVVPLAPPLEAYVPPNASNLEALRLACRLPEAFILYPAQAWPHKNHLGLLEALAILRDRHGLRVPLVCTGKLNEFYPHIRARMIQLGLEEQVQFLGFVDSSKLYGLYRLCRMVVIPTKFEAASFPMWEAFHAEAPVACSNVTSLPEQAGDAALIFDPENAAEMADAIRRLWTDSSLREILVKRGTRNLARLSWERTARIFRAHYRRLANRPLTEEDAELLTMVDPL